MLCRRKSPFSATVSSRSRLRLSIELPDLSKKNCRVKCASRCVFHFDKRHEEGAGCLGFSHHHEIIMKYHEIKIESNHLTGAKRREWNGMLQNTY